MLKILIIVPFPENCLGGPRSYAHALASVTDRISVFYFSDYSSGFLSVSSLYHLLRDTLKLFTVARHSAIVLNQDIQLLGLLSLLICFPLPCKFITRITSDPTLDRSLSSRDVKFYIRFLVASFVLLQSRSTFLPSLAFKRQFFSRLPIPKQLKDFLFSNTFVVPNPVASTITSKSIDPPAFCYDFIIASRLEECKYIDLVFDVLHCASLTNPNLRCAVVGEGSAASDLLSRSRLNACHFDFLGPLARTDLIRLMRSSRIYLNNANQETFCYTLVEAIESGCYAFFRDYLLALEIIPEDLHSRVFPFNAYTPVTMAPKLLLELYHHYNNYPRVSQPVAISKFRPSAILKLLESEVFA
jgi:glycosyltransferase involved in cell wall biosynthesis